jgi:hypothetical protein
MDLLAVRYVRGRTLVGRSIKTRVTFRFIGQSTHVIKIYKANDDRLSLECTEIIMKNDQDCYDNASCRYASFQYSI